MTWWRTNAYDPADDLRSIQSPVLAIFGEEDVNVPAEENVPVMTGHLESAGVDYSIVTIPHLPHAVTTHHSLQGGAWDWPAAYWVWGKRPLMLDSAMAGWVVEHTDH